MGDERWIVRSEGTLGFAIALVVVAAIAAGFVWFGVAWAADGELVAPAERAPDAAVEIAVAELRHKPELFVANYTVAVLREMITIIEGARDDLTKAETAELKRLAAMRDLILASADEGAEEATLDAIEAKTRELAADPATRKLVLEAARPGIAETVRQFQEAERQQAEGREQVQKRLVEINTAILAETDNRLPIEER